MNIFSFLIIYQIKINIWFIYDINKKNISFTCIRAMSGVCYAGKSAILKKKQ